METFKIGSRVFRGLFLKGGGDTLIVLAHGWCGSVAEMRSMSAEARRLFPDADQFIPQLHMGTFSYTKPQRIADQLSDDIAALDVQGGYRSVILVGHSAGALIARAAWLHAVGATEAGDAGKAVHAWAGKTGRIVLMAAINRGWSDSVAIGPARKAQFWALAIWEFLTYGLFHDVLQGVGTSGFILELRRGAPFVTGLRLKWLAVARAGGAPLVVQVLGTVDDIVSPKDNVDLITSTDFVYLEAPESGHASMIRLDEPRVGKARTEVFSLALSGGRAALEKANLAVEVADNLGDGQDDFDEDLAGADDRRDKVARVVFVIHGIRDYGFWTKKIAGRVKAAGGGRAVCRTVTSSYGFFPMGPFLFKALRRRRVEWLMDQYVRAKALYPNAGFSYMGHSNGTALMAGAMALSPAIKFEQVVFAGSVVRRDFEWNTFIESKQVKAVMNYVATDDIVVAAFPKFFQRLPGADLGSAGFDGFKRGGVLQIEYVRGGHGAALRETLWDHAARFLVGKPAGASDSQADILNRRSWFSTVVNGLGSWLLMPFIVALIGGAGLSILLFPELYAYSQPHMQPWVAGLLEPLTRSWAIALAFLAYVWFVKTVLTRL